MGLVKYTMVLVALLISIIAGATQTDTINFYPREHNAVYEMDKQLAPQSNFTGFAAALLIGVRSEAVKLDTSTQKNRYSTNGMRYMLQLEGINIRENFGYIYGLQLSYSTHNLSLPAKQNSVPVNESIRNYELHALFGVTDQYSNILAIRIGGGRVDSKEYRGSWDASLVGAVNLPIMPSLYLGLQTHMGIKSNQLTVAGSAPYVEIMASVTKRF